MNSNDDLQHIETGHPDTGIVEDLSTEDREEAATIAGLSVWVAPIVVLHIYLIYALANAIFDFRISRYWHMDRALGWVSINGLAIGLGIWFWRKGSFPVAANKWLKGREARRMILMWLGGSLAWFMLPDILDDAWDLISARLSAW